MAAVVPLQAPAPVTLWHTGAVVGPEGAVWTSATLTLVRGTPPEFVTEYVYEIVLPTVEYDAVVLDAVIDKAAGAAVAAGTGVVCAAEAVSAPAGDDTRRVGNVTTAIDNAADATANARTPEGQCFMGSSPRL